MPLSIVVESSFNLGDCRWAESVLWAMTNCVGLNGNTSVCVADKTMLVGWQWLLLDGACSQALTIAQLPIWYCRLSWNAGSWESKLCHPWRFPVWFQNKLAEWQCSQSSSVVVHARGAQLRPASNKHQSHLRPTQHLKRAQCPQVNSIVVLPNNSMVMFSWVLICTPELCTFTFTFSFMFIVAATCTFTFAVAFIAALSFAFTCPSASTCLLLLSLSLLLPRLLFTFTCTFKVVQW